MVVPSKRYISGGRSYASPFQLQAFQGVREGGCQRILHSCSKTTEGSLMDSFSSQMISNPWGGHDLCQRPKCWIDLHGKSNICHPLAASSDLWPHMPSREGHPVQKPTLPSPQPGLPRCPLWGIPGPWHKLWSCTHLPLCFRPEPGEYIPTQTRFAGPQATHISPLNVQSLQFACSVEARILLG